MENLRTCSMMGKFLCELCQNNLLSGNLYHFHMWVCTGVKVDAFMMKFQHSVNARSFNIKKEMLMLLLWHQYSEPAEASLTSILLRYDAKSFAQLDLRRYCHSSLQNLLSFTSVGCERDCLGHWTTILRSPQLFDLLLESDFSYPWPVAPSQLLKNPVLPPPSMLLCRRWAAPALLQKKDTSNEGQKGWWLTF